MAYAYQLGLWVFCKLETCKASDRVKIAFTRALTFSSNPSFL